ncbi:hypothetical protein BDV26DRAFT_269613 [Aspergillus bertholletiae]|uniref:Uncharacterized protein n=1 Tax=Aspergillus bertholletiae TaxID=1226010 RepID=A0A5N7AXZ8_9EURO|nr:hypothetical protein BDV26DRAFT_269613 [Aspergillus bertholletiae]
MSPSKTDALIARLLWEPRQECCCGRDPFHERKVLPYTRRERLQECHVEPHR